jgi:flagella basal body P-ring formation protein FlgA
MRRAGALLAAVLAAWPAASWAGGQENPQAVAVAIRQALAPTLPGGSTVSLGPVTGAHYMQACTGKLSVSVTGIEPYEQAAAHCPSPNWTLYVTVTIAATEEVEVAARPIAAGQALSAADVTLRREPVALFAGRQVYHDAAALLGTTALMSLNPGTILTSSSVEEPVIVQAGQTVTVHVHSGSLDVTLNAVAQQTGRIGQSILMVNSSSGQHFSALVTATGPVVDLN